MDAAESDVTARLGLGVCKERPAWLHGVEHWALALVVLNRTAFRDASDFQKRQSTLVFNLVGHSN